MTTMSTPIKTRWLKRFLPDLDDLVDDATGQAKAAVKAMNDKAAVKHALRKWKGLRLEVLHRYNGRKIDLSDTVVFAEESEVQIGSDTCVLCLKYLDTHCRACPLSHTLGNRCCDDTGQPYSVWVKTNNPLPMLQALQKTQRRLSQQRSPRVIVQEE